MIARDQEPRCGTTLVKRWKKEMSFRWVEDVLSFNEELSDLCGRGQTPDPRMESFLALIFITRFEMLCEMYWSRSFAIFVMFRHEMRTGIHLYLKHGTHLLSIFFEYFLSRIFEVFSC